MKERCVNVLVLKIEWETAKITAAALIIIQKGGGYEGDCFEDRWLNDGFVPTG